MVDLTITIVVIGESALVFESLNRIYLYTVGISFEVILVGNCLPSATQSQIKKHFPGVMVVSFTHVRGFTQNQNVALRLAKGRYIVLFNDDALLENNLFFEMMSFLEKHPDFGAAMPQLIYPDGSFQLGGRGEASYLTLGFYELKLHRLFPRNHILGAYPMSYWDQGLPIEIKTASGACLMIRHEVIKQAGLLDERFKFGMDDLEWSRRIRETGWKIYYLANQKLIHISLATGKKDFSTATINLYRGAFLYFYLYYGWEKARIFRLFLITGSFIQIIGWIFLYIFSKKQRTRAAMYIKGRLSALKFCLKRNLKHEIITLAAENPNTDLKCNTQIPTAIDE